MPGFIARRLVSAAAMLFVVATLIFSILQVVPGDPAEMLLSSSGRSATPDVVASLRQKMGLNKPVLTQYADFMSDMAHLNFGTSIIDGSAISKSIGERLPRTLELIVAAMILALVVALPAGTYCALHPGGIFDIICSWLSALFLSVPVFVVGTLFIYFFAQLLNLLPAGGYVAFDADPLHHLSCLLLPAVSVSIHLMAMIFRMVRSSVLETRSNDWVRTAKAKGLAWHIVVQRHILRNSLAPVITIVGLQFGVLLGSTVLVEYVYNWPGLSGLLVTAVNQRDFTVVRSVIMTVSAIFILINLFVEIIYSLLDPRIRLG